MQQQNHGLTEQDTRPPCYECMDGGRVMGCRDLVDTPYGVASKCDNCGYSELE